LGWGTWLAKRRSHAGLYFACPGRRLIFFVQSYCSLLQRVNIAATSSAVKAVHIKWRQLQLAAASAQARLPIIQDTEGREGLSHQPGGGDGRTVRHITAASGCPSISHHSPTSLRRFIHRDTLLQSGNARCSSKSDELCANLATAMALACTAALHAARHVRRLPIPTAGSGDATRRWINEDDTALVRRASSSAQACRLVPREGRRSGLFGGGSL
jgi:hypothetical protein